MATLCLLLDSAAAVCINSVQQAVFRVKSAPAVLDHLEEAADETPAEYERRVEAEHRAAALQCFMRINNLRTTDDLLSAGTTRGESGSCSGRRVGRGWLAAGPRKSQSRVGSVSVDTVEDFNGRADAAENQHIPVERAAEAPRLVYAPSVQRSSCSVRCGSNSAKCWCGRMITTVVARPFRWWQWCCNSLLYYVAPEKPATWTLDEDWVPAQGGRGRVFCRRDEVEVRGGAACRMYELEDPDGGIPTTTTSASSASLEDVMPPPRTKTDRASSSSSSMQDQEFFCGASSFELSRRDEISNALGVPASPSPRDRSPGSARGGASCSHELHCRVMDLT